MLDMFTGSHVERILEMSPELRRDLDGFIWYPDTLSPGSATVLSMGAILGGEDYTPPNINAWKPDSRIREVHRGYAVLPAIFEPRGYSVALAGVYDLSPPLFREMCPAAPQTLLVDFSIRNAYITHWREKLGLPLSAPEESQPALFLASTGLFRAAPWLVRPRIYNRGSWLQTNPVLYRNYSQGSYALLDSLPEVANARHTGHTLKYITSMLTHAPWQMDETTCMPLTSRNRYPVEDDGLVREHFATERCALLALGRFFGWMKREGVYDNTQIILVSDHGADDSPVFAGREWAALKSSVKYWSQDALLLVKQRGARGELQVDGRPMSSADVAPLICVADGPCPLQYADPLGERTSPRVRIHSAGTPRQPDDRFITTDFLITGKGSDPRNWEILEGQT
jgi:YidC/Oxa1 family membrane protein insertase